MADGQVLAVGVAGDPGAIFAALSADYEVHAEPSETMQWTWLDTADWRLHRAGLALREQRRGRARELVLDAPGAAPLIVELTGVSWPARLEKLETGALRQRLDDVVGVRALLPVAQVEARRILLRLLDGLAKTRVRVSLDQQRLLAPRRAALPMHVTVRALRGYDEDAARCVSILGAAMAAETTTLSPPDAALAAAGHLPGAPRPRRRVEPTDPALQPVAWTLLEQAETLVATVDGVRGDLDTEFLHDLRTAARSSRALLHGVNELLPGRSAVRAARDLDWLDGLTAPLRNVDLALFELSGAGELVVADLPELDPLAEALTRRRRGELRRLRQALSSPRGRTLFAAWRDDLELMTTADPIGPTAFEAAAELGVAACRAVSADTGPPRGDRVAAAREVLATFAELYRPRTAARIRADLDDLDEAIRRHDRFRLVASQLTEAAGDGQYLETVLSAGALLERLHALEHHAATLLADRLAAFADEDGAERIGRLSR